MKSMKNTLQIIKVKYDIPNRELQKFDTLTRSIDRKLDALRAQRKEAAL